MPHTLPEQLILPLGDEPNTVPLHLTLVQPGHFLMGSEAEEAYDDEKPEHLVHITQPFYLGKFPVTQAQWEAVFPGHNPSDYKGPFRPVENVSWHDIVDGTQEDGPPEAFLTRINRELVKDPVWAGYAFRLPTEAEWEYAAKGGHFGPQDFGQDTATEEVYPEYVGSDEVEKAGWFEENSNSITHPVGRKQPNALGFYDLSGNVWEWCADWYAGDASQSRKDSGNTIDSADRESCLGRVLRGGSSLDSARGCCLTLRFDGGPEIRVNDCGFRLVLAPVRASE